MASRHGECRPAGFPVSRLLTLAKPAPKTPPGSTTCAAYPTKPDRWPGPDQPTPPASDDRTERFGASRPAESARLSPPTAGRRPSDRRSDLHGRSQLPAGTPCTPRAPPSVPIARTDPRSSCTGSLLPVITHHPSPCPTDCPPHHRRLAFVPSSRPFPLHGRPCPLPRPRHRPRPHRRRRPLTTQRNGSAHPPLPKSACLSASCRANAPARPDRRVRPCSLRSPSIPASGATRSCRTRATSPRLDLAGAAAWARSPGRASRPARPEPPPPPAQLLGRVLGGQRRGLHQPRRHGHSAQAPGRSLHSGEAAQVANALLRSSVRPARPVVNLSEPHDQSHRQVGQTQRIRPIRALGRA